MTNKFPEMTKVLELLQKDGWDKAIAASYNIDNKQYIKLRNAYYKSRERLLNYIIKHGEHNERRP